MEALIIYIAKTGICLGVFLIIYTLFLRPTTFFRLNRLFLLSGFFFSLIFPAIKYTYDVVLPASNIPVTQTLAENVAAAAPASQISIWMILSGLYLAGIFILIIRNTYSYIKLHRLVKTGTIYKDKGFNVIENRQVNSPFTVLNYILLDTSRLSDTEKKLILKHEITHVSQKHWVDLLCSECMLMLQWFNPLAWVYVKLLKENHEFLADKAVIDSGVSPALYQAVLINQKFQGPVFSFSNSFNYSKPLNRLSMIKKAKSSPWKRAVVLAVIPIFGLFVWASAEPRYVLDTSVSQMPEVSVSNVIPEYPEDSVVVIGYGTQHKKTSTKIAQDVYVTRSDTKEVTDTTKNVKVKVVRTDKSSEPLVIIDGKKGNMKDLEIDPDRIDNITVLKDKEAIAAYGKKAKNGVIIVTTKEHAKKQTKDRIVTVTTVTTDDNEPGIIKPEELPSMITFGTPTSPLVIIDGVKQRDKKKFEKLDVRDIESFTILKDKSAIETYGEEGKNGVIIVTIKASKKWNNFL
ncbi:M56 family metallopeptidase [Prevotella sp. 10(H)]|uniref:M56 family metallopeptidase n=1 Tax=Prevotella sp. 10(H) TaxID=1158294 RepID=UPI0004A74186|nr:M56 family metallopeptidase [Prevotella sp. 10(H)]